MHFRSRTEEDVFEQLIGEKIITDASIRNKIIRNHTYYAKKLLELYKKIDKTDKITISMIKQLNEGGGKFFGYNTFIQRGIDYVGKDVKNKKINQLLIKQRTKYEKKVVE